jgi:hypothetical protein
MYNMMVSPLSQRKILGAQLTVGKGLPMSVKNPYIVKLI